MKSALEFIVANWPAISAIAVIILEQILPKTNKIAANSTTELICNAAVSLLKKGATKGVICLALLFMCGCVSFNSTIQGCSKEGKQTVKSDSDMTPTTNTKASLGVGVGQAPTVTSGSIK